MPEGEEDLTDDDLTDQTDDKIILHDFHQYACNRRAQLERFDELHNTQQNEKIQFYYIVGKEEQAHFGFVNRVAYEKSGRLLDVSNPGLGANKLAIEEVVLENISDIEHLKKQLIKKLLAKFQINPNANDPILTKDYSKPSKPKTTSYTQA